MSTRESMLATEPAKLRPGNAGAVARIDRPSRNDARKFSGTEKSSLMTLVSSSVVMTSPGLMSVPTLTRRKPDAPRERRANHGVFETRAAPQPAAHGLP